MNVVSPEYLSDLSLRVHMSPRLMVIVSFGIGSCITSCCNQDWIPQGSAPDQDVIKHIYIHRF